MTAKFAVLVPGPVPIHGRTSTCLVCSSVPCIGTPERTMNHEGRKKEEKEEEEKEKVEEEEEDGSKKG